MEGFDKSFLMETTTSIAPTVLVVSVLSILLCDDTNGKLHLSTVRKTCSLLRAFLQSFPSCYTVYLIFHLPTAYLYRDSTSHPSTLFQSSSTMSHSMDMSMSGMDMGTATSTAVMASATGMSGMGGMNMDSGAHACKISMLWNWDTLDTCFVSSSWKNTSQGMFAGSCIGVLFLVISLEFLRRAGKEFDRYLVSQQNKLSLARVASDPSPSSGFVNKDGPDATTRSVVPQQSFRPNFLQQLVRALLHMLQFAVAYFIMLLAMYYNGYILICIFIGAYIGFFIFGWESFNVSQGGRDRLQEEVTVCCG